MSEPKPTPIGTVEPEPEGVEAPRRVGDEPAENEPQSRRERRHALEAEDSDESDEGAV